MQAFQSLTRHQLVMDSLSLGDSTPESTPPPSPSIHPAHHRPFHLPSTPTNLQRRRSSPSLRRTQSYQDVAHDHHNNNGHNNNNSFQRRPSRFDLCRTETSRITSWSEYTVRKTLVRFRTRKTAMRRPLRRLSGHRRVPSETIKSVLDNGYEVCKSMEASVTERLSAVLYCWFYRWIMDVYYHFTADGTERSFIKWMLATLLVTLGAILVVILSTCTLHQVNFLILILLNAGVQYITFILIIIISLLGILAIINFD